MKKLLLLMAMLLALPGLALAQVQSCPDCVLGIFDAEDLVHNYGTFGEFTKTIYIGIKYDPNTTFDSCTGVEFSVQGLPPLLLPPSFNIRNGGFAVGTQTPITPADTTAMDATGGWNVVWNECQPGNRVVVEIVMVSFDPIPNDTVIRVLRKWPQSNAETPQVLFTQCNSPIYTLTTMKGDCYVLNPTVNPGESVGNPPCLLKGDAVEATTWSGIKSLFR